MNIRTDKNRFNELIYAAPNATAIYHSRDIIITAANADMLAFWGKDETVIGRRFLDGIPELIGQPFFQQLQTVYDTGIPYHAEHASAELRVDGRLQTFYFNYTYKPILGPDGKTEAIIHSAIDVTPLIHAQHQLEEIQEKLHLALDSAEIGTWVLDPLNLSVHCDKRCLDLLGLEGNSAVDYNSIFFHIHPEDKPKMINAVNLALDPKSLDTYDIRFRIIGNKNGRICWVHCKGRSYFHANGSPYRFAGTVRDITSEVNTSQSEQQLLALVNYNVDHMSIADMSGNLIYMNKAARTMLGVPKEIEIRTLNAQDFYEPEELRRVQETIIPKIDTEEGWTGILNLRNYQTGENIPCQVNYILIKNPVSGEIIGRGATARDLRGELKAKAELQMLATIVEISEDFCNYVDLDGNTIYINAAGQKLIGLDDSNLSQAHIYSYHSSESSLLISTVIMKELIERGKWSGRLDLKHLKTGEIIPIHKQLFIIRDELNGQALAIGGIARDLRAEINAAKTMDKKNTELNQAFKELEFLANAVPAVVWTATADGMLDFINDRWYEHSDVPIEQALGNKWVNALHPDDLTNTIEEWMRCVSKGEPFQAEFRLKDKNGNYRWWLVRALALADTTGIITKWYGTNTDISEQKELEKQKDNFLSVASHELKTPVTSIKAYAQVLETLLKRSGHEKNAELMSKMNRQINRLISLISDLLDVTKINSGRLQFQNIPFNFNEMVIETIGDIQLGAEKHEIQTNFGELAIVTGDRERIRQIVVNLLTNAIKYSPDANRIIVYTEDHGEEVQLCVQDFGIGLNKDKKDKVFEQFYRVSGTKEHTFPGLGLGLYISSEIVKQLGGRIWVNSVQGKGSTFCFAIPIKQSNI